MIHLLSMLCKLELKCGSLQTGCDIYLRGGVGDALDTDKQETRGTNNVAVLLSTLFGHWSSCKISNRAQCTVIKHIHLWIKSSNANKLRWVVLWCQMSTTGSDSDMRYCLPAAIILFQIISTHVAFTNDLWTILWLLFLPHFCWSCVLLVLAPESNLLE